MKRQMIMLENLTCPSCAAKLERSTAKLPGMKSAKVSFGTGALTVEFDEAQLAPESIRAVIKQHGLGVATILGA